MTELLLATDVRLAPFEAVNARRLDATPFWDANTRYDLASSGVLRGRDEIIEHFTGLLRAMPDLTITPRRHLIDGPVSVVEWTATATFDGVGKVEGVASTGSPVALRGVDIFEWDGDVVVRNTAYTDGVDFARQIGMLPQPGTIGDQLLAGLFNTATQIKRLGRRP